MGHELGTEMFFRLIHYFYDQGGRRMRRTTYSYIWIFLFYGVSAFAQAPDTAWTRTIGGPAWDGANYIQQTSDGGYIIAGYSTVQSGSFADIYIVKTDEFGYTVWSDTLGGGAIDKAYCVQQTWPDDGYIFAGQMDGDMCLIRKDADGQTLWMNTFGGAELDRARSVQQTSDGGFILVGSTASYGYGELDIYLIRTDPSGNQIWARTFGGIYQDQGYCVQQTTDGGFIVAGSTYSFGGYDRDMYLIRTDSVGNAIWSEIFGDSGFDVANSVQQTDDGGFIFGGAVEFSSTNGIDFALLKTDSDGNVQWVNTYGSPVSELGYSVQVIQNSGYILAGNRTYPGNRDIYVVRTDTSGDTLWTQTYGGPEYENGYCVQITADGGYIIAGDTRSYGAGYTDMYLIKLGSDQGIESEGENDQPVASFQTISPNPFSSELHITFSIHEETLIELSIFDLSGRLVDELSDAQLPAGEHTVIWNTTDDIPVGCYLVVLDAYGYHITERCLKLN